MLENFGGRVRKPLGSRWRRDNVLPFNRRGGFFRRGQRRAFERKEEALLASSKAGQDGAVQPCGFSRDGARRPVGDSKGLSAGRTSRTALSLVLRRRLARSNAGYRSQLSHLWFVRGRSCAHWKDDALRAICFLSGIQPLVPSRATSPSWLRHPLTHDARSPLTSLRCGLRSCLTAPSLR